jgi:hypothetical protein
VLQPPTGYYDMPFQAAPPPAPTSLSGADSLAAQSAYSAGMHLGFDVCKQDYKRNK